MDRVPRHLFAHLPAPADAVLATVADAAADLRRGLAVRRGAAGTENSSGEAQLAADVWADSLLVERIARLDGVGWIASEERQEAVEASGEGFSVLLDPLDGSSNLRSNNAVGTIVGVARGPPPAGGRDLVAAAYVLYGPVTTMMVAGPEGVREILLDGAETRVLQEAVTLPEPPAVYGFGGRAPDWPAAIAELAAEFGRDLKLRMGGAMAGDVNQVLTYGGIFAYPMLRSKPEGKLRLQFEGAPMAFLVERAGGAGSDGYRSLLDVAPTGLHQRTPVFLGNRDLVARVEARVRGEGAMNPEA